jgi:hypothetical protein
MCCADHAALPSKKALDQSSFTFRKQGSLPTRYGSDRFQSLGRQDLNLQPDFMGDSSNH